jgi:hypothetical protein
MGEEQVDFVEGMTIAEKELIFVECECGNFIMLQSPSSAHARERESARARVCV